MVAGIRTLKTNGHGIVRLLQALSADPDVRVVNDAIPLSAAFARMRTNDHDHTIELDVMSHDWPEGTDLTVPLDFRYARRYGSTGTHGDWSAPIGVD